MTMPHLMNCPHTEAGWCGECVIALWEEKERFAALSTQPQAPQGAVMELALEALDDDSPYGRFLAQRLLRDALAGITANTSPTGVTGWQPIETAPETTEDKYVLLNGKFGMHMGKVFNYGGGDIVVFIPHIAGDAAEGISHFMPIPAAPETPEGKK